MCQAFAYYIVYCLVKSLSLVGVKFIHIQGLEGF